jgi:hypothetical protein
VKRLMEHLGLKVARLIRVSFGPFHLGHLPEGQVDEIPGKVWREQLGMTKKGPRPHPPSGAARELPPQGGKAREK